MSPPSGTRNEYSRKHRASGRDSRANSIPDSGVTTPPDAVAEPSPGKGQLAPPRRAAPRRTFKTDVIDRLGRPLAHSRGLRAAILGCTLLGAAILVAAEFSTLYTVRAAG